MALVFVYGTLKRRGRNHRKLLCSKYIGEGATGPSFRLVNLGRAPGVIPGNHCVYGEVYEVDSDTLHDLDELENLGWVYDREEVEILLSDQKNTNKLTCWIYVFKPKFFTWLTNWIFGEKQ